MVDPTPATSAPFGAAPPVVNYAANYSAPQQTSAPLWQVKPGHWNKYLYVVAAVVVLVIAGIFLSSLGPIYLPWFGGSNQAVTPTPGPSLLSKRSDYAAADQFETGTLQPAIVAFNKAVSAQTLSCNGVLTLSVGCQEALTVTNGQLQSALSAVNKDLAPLCIEPNVLKISVDLAGLEIYMKNALQAFSDSSKRELAAAFSGFFTTDHSLQVDFNASQALGLLCDTQLTGP
jgi:hypothetical protein